MAKIIIENDKYAFRFRTGRKIPKKSDPTQLRPEYIHRSGFRTKKEAEEAFDVVKQQVKSGLRNDKQTFSEFVDSWLPIFSRNNSKGKSLSKRTFQTYQSMVEKHLKPFFGETKIKDITFNDVEAYIDLKLVNGLSKQTVKHHYRLLALIAKAGVKRGVMARNVVLEADCPQPDKLTLSELEKQVLNLREQKLLRNKAREEAELDPNIHTKPRHIMIELGLAMGLRMSEVLAIKWGDIVTSTEKKDNQFVKMLKVQRALDGFGSFKSTKSEAGIRTIPLDGELLQTLWQYKAWLDSYREGRSDWEDNDLIIPTKNGSSADGRTKAQGMRGLFDRTRIEGSFHTLRHSCITNWLQSVPNIKLVSTLAGHSSIGITLDRYGHVLEENAISEMDNLYSTIRSTN